MSEAAARNKVIELAPDALPLLDRYAALLVAENAKQNLIARSTESAVWQRHLLDSVQLAQFARPTDVRWLDVGSGAGLPGIVIAILGRWSVTLVEPRRKRAAFLEDVVRDLGLADTQVVAADVRAVASSYDLISARAVGHVDTIFGLTRRCATPATRFILPKGRSARTDVENASTNWHGLFHVEQSLTDPAAGIVIADEVRPR